MPDLDQTGATGGRATRSSATSDRTTSDSATSGRAPSRRSVLRAAAGAGAAGLAAGTLTQMAVAAPAGVRSGAGNARPASQEASGSEAIVAHVRDAATGEIDVFHGASVTRVRDKALAARLVRASR